MEDIRELTDIEFDVLKEISNIGTGHAATAISRMMDGKVAIQVPKIDFVEFSTLSDFVGGAEQEVIGILVTLERDIEGMMMFLLNKESATIIVNKMLGRNKDIIDGPLDDLENSVLTEFGNIIAGSYLSAVSKLTDLSVYSNVPALSDDMAGAILSVPAIEFAKISDKALIIESVVETEQNSAKGYFILIPTLSTFKKIFRKLGLEG